MSKNDLWSFGVGTPAGLVCGLVHALIFPGNLGFWWTVVAWIVAYGLIAMFTLRLFRYASD